MLREVGFYDRARMSSGTFLDRAEIEKSPRQTTVDLLGSVPGIQVDNVLNPMAPTVTLRGGAAASSRTQGTSDMPQCYPAVYLDGLRVQEGGAIGNRGDFSASSISDMSDFFSFGNISPEQIEGIEVFGRPSQVPVQYLTQSAVCGVILIWTRAPGGG